MRWPTALAELCLPIKRLLSEPSKPSRWSTVAWSTPGGDARSATLRAYWSPSSSPPPTAATQQRSEWGAEKARTEGRRGKKAGGGDSHKHRHRGVRRGHRLGDRRARLRIADRAVRGPGARILRASLPPAFLPRRRSV